MALKKDTTIVVNNSGSNPLTLNSLANICAVKIYTNPALITSPNNPKVINFNGKKKK